MNMMPRWDNGWGLQLIDEYRHEDDLLLGDRTAYSGFTENVHLLHFQGVYTFVCDIHSATNLERIHAHTAYFLVHSLAVASYFGLSVL